MSKIQQLKQSIRNQIREQRKAKHILIGLAADADTETQNKAKTEIESVLARINSGESFEALAKEKSQDPGSASNGGDLGWITKGMMVPEFETALYKMKKAEISAPVKSSFGYHIIKLDDVKTGDVDSFESKKPELVAQYKEQILEDSFYEKSELMATTAYENDQSLQEVADALGLTIKTVPAFSRAQGTGIASNDKVRSAAFDSAVLSEGRNSDIIEIEKRHAIVLRVDTHKEATPKALDEVKTQIITSIKVEKANQKSKSAALVALAKLESGESIDSKSVKGSAELLKLGSVKRDDRTANRKVLSDAFTMPKPEGGKAVYQVVELANGTAVVELKSVTSPDASSAEELKTFASQYQKEQANRDMAAVLDHLKSQAEIVRSEEL